MYLREEKPFLCLCLYNFISYTHARTELKKYTLEFTSYVSVSHSKVPFLNHQ